MQRQWLNPGRSRKGSGRKPRRLPDSQPDAGKLLLPALNSMIDFTTTRTMAPQTHPPRVIYALLFGLGFVGSLVDLRGDMK